MDKKGSKKKLNGLDYYIIYCILACVIFAVVEIVVSTKTGILHDSLCVAWFGFHGSEVFCAALIKRMKLRNDAESEEERWRES